MYTAWTRGSRATWSGGPSASTAPATRTEMRSAKLNTSVGKLQHVGPALGGHSVLGLLLFDFHAELGKPVFLEDKTGLSDLADFILAMRAVDLNVVIAGGELLKQRDDRADRLGDAVLADQEAKHNSSEDTHE
jgi:hypothetical protein